MVWKLHDWLMLAGTNIDSRGEESSSKRAWPSTPTLLEHTLLEMQGLDFTGIMVTSPGLEKIEVLVSFDSKVL